MASEEIKELKDIEPETTPGYVPSRKISITDLQKMDEKDESLVQYKRRLLSIDEYSSPADEPRTVVVEKMAFIVDGRDDVTFDLTVNHPEAMKLLVKEGAEYKIRVSFHVYHEIVSGLKYHHVVKKAGINADKQTYMVGSYSPRGDPHQWTSPGDDAPKGMIARGNYKIHSKFLDDDGDVHLEWDWEMEIKQDWE